MTAPKNSHFKREKSTAVVRNDVRVSGLRIVLKKVTGLSDPAVRERSYG